MLLTAIYWLLVAVVSIVASLLICMIALKRVYFQQRTEPQKATIAFFHPYCAAGGGGERVLWCAIAALGDVHNLQHTKVVIYSGEPPENNNKILDRVKANFGIEIPQQIHLEFIYVPGRELLEAVRYPRFTMLGQSLGSVIYAWNALRLYNPDVFVDTTGYAFTFLVAKLLADCQVGCYVHYPTITKEMITKVVERRPDYNNPDAIASSQVMTNTKVAYYRFFAWLYSLMGGLTDTVMVNSTWTKNHVDSLWKLPLPRRSESDIGEYRPVTGLLPSLFRAFGVSGQRPSSRTVFPPCNTALLASLRLGNRERVIVSVAQFRPEKDHALQLRAFALFLQKDLIISADSKNKDVRLCLVGGARDAGDQERVEKLRALAAELKIDQSVDFCVNVSLAKLQSLLGSATAGLHTMWNEHFGIGVVEMMAAGVITIANNSGGPKADIVVEHAGKPTGFLALTPEEYADCLQKVFGGQLDTVAMAANARDSTQRFCDAEFSLGFFGSVVPLAHEAQRNAKQRRKAEGLHE